MLHFDAAAHRYTWDSAHVPGVTSILGAAVGDLFGHIAPAVLERKRQIGTAAHLACHLDDIGQLDETTVHLSVLPYLNAWRAFRRESRCAVIMSEQKVFHPTHRYAGTLDRVIKFDDERLAVVDIKTGLPGPLAALQTAAYAEAVAAEYGAPEKPVRRYAMRALPTGRYKLEEYTNPGDFRDFLACLLVARIKERIANE